MTNLTDGTFFRTLPFSSSSGPHAPGVILAASRDSLDKAHQSVARIEPIATVSGCPRCEAGTNGVPWQVVMFRVVRRGTESCDLKDLLQATAADSRAIAREIPGLLRRRCHFMNGISISVIASQIVAPLGIFFDH